MDRHGIGTDATMHEHIKTIQERGYCVQDSGRKFIPSELGIALVKAVGAYSGRLGGFHLAKPTLRANMERDMGLIAEGRLNRSQFIANYVQLMREIFQMISDHPQMLDAEIRRMNVQGPARAVQQAYQVRDGLPGYGGGQPAPAPTARRTTRNTNNRMNGGGRRNAARRRPTRNNRNNRGVN